MGEGDCATISDEGYLTCDTGHVNIGCIGMHFQIDSGRDGDIKLPAPYWVSIDDDDAAFAVLLKSIDTEVPWERDIGGTDDLEYDFVGVGSSMDVDSGKVYVFISLAVDHQGWVGLDGYSGWAKDRPVARKARVADEQQRDHNDEGNQASQARTAPPVRPLMEVGAARHHRNGKGVGRVELWLLPHVWLTTVTRARWISIGIVITHAPSFFVRKSAIVCLYDL